MFFLDCVLVDHIVLLFNIEFHIFDAFALCYFLQVIHVEFEPFVAVVHVLYLVVDEDLSVLVILLCDVDKSLHNLAPLFPVAAGV